MKIKPYSVTLKDGKTYTVRGATGRDGTVVNAFRRQLAAETDFLLRYPDEVPLSADGETKKLFAAEDDDKDVFLLLWDGKTLVGSMHVYGVSGFDKFKHRAEVGVQVAKSHWSVGAGKFLMTEAVRYAKRMGFDLLELFCAGSNERGIGLYKHLGFAEFSRLPGGFHLRDGRTCDEVGMYLDLRDVEVKGNSEK